MVDDIEKNNEKASDIRDKVKATEDSEFSPLLKRMDEDFALWNGESPPVNEFEATIRGQTKAHGSDINIVSNDLRVFSDNVQSKLSASDMDIAIRMAETTGDDKRDEMGMLERLLYFAFEKADERLRRLLLPPLRETSIWYSAIRGWTAARILVRGEGNGKNRKVVFDFMPLDPKYLIYKVGGSGLLWSGYKMFRTKEQIEDVYENTPQKKRDNLVIDYWKHEDDKIWNGVICDGKFLKELEIVDIPSMPILIMPVSTRPPVGDSDNVKGYGESLFASARHINAVRNRFASIVANHANLMANQGLINYKDDMGVEIPSTTNVSGGVVTLSMGHNKLEASPMKEISPTVVNMLNWLNGQLDQSLLPKIPIGTPAPSGTLFGLAQESGDKVFNPQLRTLNYFYADMCHLIEEQLIEGKLKVKVQRQEGDKYFETQVSPKDLKKPHTIKVTFTAQTPWSQQGTAALADMMLRQGIPTEWIWENIYRFSDPKGMKDQSLIEMAEHSPEQAQYASIEALIKYGRLEEAMLQMQDLAQRKMQEQGEAPPPVAPRGEV